MSNPQAAGVLPEPVASAIWYQTLKLPGGVVAPGNFDTLSEVERVPFPSSLKNKRCLDIGQRTVSGPLRWNAEAPRRYWRLTSITLNALIGRGHRRPLSTYRLRSSLRRKRQMVFRSPGTRSDQPCSVGGSRSTNCRRGMWVSSISSSWEVSCFTSATQSARWPLLERFCAASFSRWMPFHHC
jgi:hypothetical protein